MDSGSFSPGAGLKCELHQRPSIDLLSHAIQLPIEGKVFYNRDFRILEYLVIGSVIRVRLFQTNSGSDQGRSQDLVMGGAYKKFQKFFPGL